VDYGAALEMRFAATRRGFESLPLRQDDNQEVGSGATQMRLDVTVSKPIER
jgi:hypothetical protein